MQLAPMHPCWPNIELKNHLSCMKINFDVQGVLMTLSKWLFSGSATTPLVVKIWTKQPWLKIKNSHDFDRDFALFKGKIWLWLFYNLFCVMVLRFYTKKSQVISTKNKGVTAIFPNFDFILYRENQHHSFIFAPNVLNFFV